MKKLTLVLAVLALLAAPVHPSLAADAAKEPIRIGELFCYTGCADQAINWRNGWQLALEEINANGGALGRKIEVVSRDDKSDPAQTIKVLEELNKREDIRIIFGTILSHTTLAASNFAKQNEMLFVRGFDGSTTLTGANGHDLYFQVGAPRIVEVKHFAKAAVKSEKKRWAFIAADYEAGHYYVDEFIKQLSLLAPDAVFIDPIYFPFGKLDAGAVTQIVAHTKPDAIFFVAGGNDFARFVREGTKRNLFKDRFIIAPWSGMAPYLSPLGKEAPVAWVTSQGYPSAQITDPLQEIFISSYKATFNADPDTGAYYAYTTLHLLAKAIEQTGTLDPASIAKTMHTAIIGTPVGPISFRADGISNRGIWIGKTGFYNGKPTVLDAEYVVPDKYLPTVEENMNSRKGQK